LLQRLADDAADTAGERIYRDAAQAATETPGAVPDALQQFARAAIAAALRDARALPRALGEYLTEPKATVWFEPAEPAAIDAGVALDRRTRMMYDSAHVFINGESYRASGRDAALMRRLADRGAVSAGDVARASDGARELLASWQEAGWVQASEEGDHER
jgi:50S ribosomal protein L16 3-hydroxylase